MLFPSQSFSSDATRSLVTSILAMQVVESLHCAHSDRESTILDQKRKKMNFIEDLAEL